MSEPVTPTLEAMLSETADVPERALRIYARLWQFETWLRRMVYVELKALHGNAWSQALNLRPGPFNTDKALTHMPTPEMNALSYSQLADLIKLVEADWDCFRPYFPPQDLWKSKLVEISQIRHRCAHFRIGHADDHSRLMQFLRDVDKGFWTFCTTYNNAQPVLPADRDAVSAHFLSKHPLPWSQTEEGAWIQVGRVNREPVIGVMVGVQRRPWAVKTPSVDGSSGYLYDIILRANDRIFDYDRLFEQTKDMHEHVVHLVLDAQEDDLRITLPAKLGSGRVIEIVEQLIEIAHFCVGRQRPVVGLEPEALAASWPEYVLGPKDVLAYLSPDMPCSFFSV